MPPDLTMMTSSIISIFVSNKLITLISEAATGAVVLKKAVRKNFAIFTEKHLRWSLFLIKLQAYFEEHFRTAASIPCFQISRICSFKF